MNATAHAEALRLALASLVLKDGVMLGGLAEPARALALGLAWCALPMGTGLRETEVNAVLKRCLAEEGKFLDVDHVELRRWLVDAGWLARDGFGREYRRVDVAELQACNAPAASMLAGLDPQSWVANVRASDEQQRTARRRAWEARQGSVAKGSA